MDVPRKEEVFVKTEVFNDELQTSELKAASAVLDFVPVEIKQEPLAAELQSKALQLRAPTKSNYLTLKEKSQILEELNKGAGVTTLAKKYGVAKSTVCSIRTKEKLIFNAVRNTFVGPGKRKTLKRSDFPKMEMALYEWFLSQQEKSRPVTGQILKEKAKSLHQELRESESEFTASDGWLHRFKSRHGVRFLKLSGEKSSLRPEPADSFSEKLNSEIEEHVDCLSVDIDTCNESRMFDDIESCHQTDTESHVLEKSETKPSVSARDAVQIFSQALEWAQENDVDYTDVLVLHKLREKAIKLNSNQN